MDKEAKVQALLESGQPIKLNLGAGHQPYNGFTGLDLGGYAADIIHDLRDPLPFPDNSIDEIFASHVVEHFAFHEIERMLVDWNRVLKAKTGVFWGFVPDIPAVAAEYLKAVEEHDWYRKRQWIANFNGGWASDRYIGEGQVHYACYDEELLRDKLTTAHFSPIIILHEHPSWSDYRLTFVCGKGIYEPSEPPLKFKVPWAPWRDEPEEEHDG